MPRAKGGFKTRKRRKKVIDMAKGFTGARKNVFTVATEAVDQALRHAYKGRKLKKRDFRALWITRINAAARAAGITYSQLMNGIKKAEIALDRKSIAYLAYHDTAAFNALADAAKAKLAA